MASYVERNASELSVLISVGLQCCSISSHYSPAVLWTMRHHSGGGLQLHLGTLWSPVAACRSVALSLVPIGTWFFVGICQRQRLLTRFLEHEVTICAC